MSKIVSLSSRKLIARMETRHEHETNRQQTRGLQSGRMVASVGLGEVDAPHSSSPGRKAPGGGGGFRIREDGATVLGVLDQHPGQMQRHCGVEGLKGGKWEGEKAGRTSHRSDHNARGAGSEIWVPFGNMETQAVLFHL